MTVLTSTKELENVRASEKMAPSFVPTMGNLHAGHISLLAEALKFSDVAYFSIFVNPKQFGPQEDFQRYPRTLEDDLIKIRECLEQYPGKRVVVYAPRDPREVFPEGREQNIHVRGLSSILEGALRPGHFEGVATVVYRLFELVKPGRAYFGLKDYQQYLVIRQMVQDLMLPIEIVGMPIIREASGLALSSRNQYLSPEEKVQGLELSRTLRELESHLGGKQGNVKKAKELIQQKLKDPRWNYLELRDAETLAEDVSRSRRISLLGVYQLGTTRLLDNAQLELA